MKWINDCKETAKSLRTVYHDEKLIFCEHLHMYVYVAI